MRGMSVESIMNTLHPESDKIDRRILYELTGLKFDEADYLDDSSFSEDDQDEAYDGNGIGYGELSLISQEDRQKSQRTKLMS